MALTILESTSLYEEEFEKTLPVLDLPQFIKNSYQTSLVDYLEAIKLDGYDPTTKRKVFIFGNTGTHLYLKK